MQIMFQCVAAQQSLSVHYIHVITEKFHKVQTIMLPYHHKSQKPPDLNKEAGKENMQA